MKIKKIVIEAEFLEFSTLQKMLNEILDLARNGEQFVSDGVPFQNHIRQNYQFFMEFKTKKNWEEKEIDGVMHKIIKSKL